MKSFESSAAEIESLRSRMTMWYRHVNSEFYPCRAVTNTRKECSLTEEEGKKAAGDDMLFNALLYFAGVESGADVVRRSQGADGRWWRSPIHVGNAFSGQSTFSKDHALGVLLYLAMSKDRGAAKRWLELIESNSDLYDPIEIDYGVLADDVARELQNLGECIGRGAPCIIHETVERWEDLTLAEKAACGLLGATIPPAGVVCPAIIANGKKLVESKEVPRFVRVNLARFCDDIHCVVLPAQYAMMYRVWRHIGLEPSLKMKLFQDLAPESLALSQIRRNHGSELHLDAVTQLLNRITGRGFSRKAVKKIIEKQPLNPFFQWLDDQPTASILRRFLEVSDFDLEHLQESRGHQWTWLRDAQENAQADSMVWDFIFMGTLLTRRFEQELADYKAHVFPGLLRKARELLDESRQQFRDEVRRFTALHRRYDDFFARTHRILSSPDTTYDKLQALNTEAMNGLRLDCPERSAGLGRLVELVGSDHDDLLALRDESHLRHFAADRLDEQEAIWKPILEDYSDIETLQARARDLLRAQSLCARLLDVLIAIPLKIEQERVRGVIRSLVDLNAEVLKALRDSIRAETISQSRLTLVAEAGRLSSQLKSARQKRQFSRAQAMESMRQEWSEVVDRTIPADAGLTQQERQTLVTEAQRSIDRQLRLWAEYRQALTPRGIINSRATAHNRRVESFRGRLVALPSRRRFAMLYLWFLLNERGGYSFPETCRDLRDVLDRDECWVFQIAPEASMEEFLEFDRILERSEGILRRLGALLPD